MKKIISAVLAILLSLSLFTSAGASSENTPEQSLDNFVKVNEYAEEMFSDVYKDDWFAKSVQSAYELGLMKGVAENSFNPGGVITIAETIALAARLNSIYYSNDTDFNQGDIWYQVYVDYAISEGIIHDGEYSDYLLPATRAQFACIIRGSLPEEAFQAINNVPMGKLPDVMVSDSYSASVYDLYNAGILTGNDEYGTFAPYSSITRNAVAAIITRTADESLRKTFTLIDKPIAVTGLTIDKTNASIYVGETINLSTEIFPYNATDNSVIWSSSNSNVATVNNGTITAVSQGSCVITATTNNYISASCTVKVSKLAVSNITLDRASADLLVGETVNLSATITPENATDKSITWFSSNSNVATVSNGIVTAVGKGTCVITARTDNYKTAQCTINVTKPAGIRIGGTCIISINSVGGASPAIYWKNVSGKTIKYITFTVYPYNSVGDMVCSSIGRKSITKLKLTGPIETYNYPNDSYGDYLLYERGIYDIYDQEKLYEMGYGLADRNEPPYIVTNYNSWMFGDDLECKKHYLNENDYQNTFPLPDCWDSVWYNSTIRGITVTSVYVEYTDGATELINNPPIG